MARALFQDRWRIFADLTALLLGINLWASIVLIPSLTLGHWEKSWGATTALAALPLLGVGIAKRREGLLLFAFPTSLLLPVAVSSDIASLGVYGPIRFTLVSLGFLLYLFAASALVSWKEVPAPVSIRSLRSASTPEPPRWKRRWRMYRAFTLISLVYPMLLLHRINFDEEGYAMIQSSFPGRAQSFTALLNLMALLLWVVLVSRFFISPIHQHRSGDLPLVRRLRLLRQGDPSWKYRVLFAMTILTALTGVGVWLSYR